MGTVCLLSSCLPILNQLKWNKAVLTGPWTSSLSWEHVCETRTRMLAYTQAGRLIMQNNWQMTLLLEGKWLRVCDCMCAFSTACLTKFYKETESSIRHQLKVHLHTLLLFHCFREELVSADLGSTKNKHFMINTVQQSIIGYWSHKGGKVLAQSWYIHQERHIWFGKWTSSSFWC